LLWGGNLALGRESCSGEGILLWGGKCCSKELLWGVALESVRIKVISI